MQAQSANSASWNREVLLERLQMMSISMLKTAIAAMEVRNPRSGSCFAERSGGVLGFSGRDVPLTRAVGVGTTGAVNDGDIASIEDFYSHVGSPVRIAITERTNPELTRTLRARGYQAGSHVDNWWLPIYSAPARETPGVEVIPVGKNEADLWVRAVAAGFEEVDSPVDEGALPQSMLDTFYCFGFANGAQAFLARRNGEVAGGGVLHMNGETAHIRTASCRFAHREHGVHTALLRVRLETAFNAGCRIAFSSTERFALSVRNLVRVGFRPLSTSFLMSTVSSR